MGSNFEVSQTKVGTWRQCRRMYWFRYVLRVRRRVKSRPLQFGSLVHDALAASAAGEDTQKALARLGQQKRAMFAAERDLYGDIVQDAKYILEAYQQHWASEPIKYRKIRGRKAEIEIRLEIAPGLQFLGYLDNVGEYGEDLWVVERKTGKDLPDESTKWRDMQANSYLAVWGHLDMPPVAGILWDCIRSKSPTRPRLLKGGALSRADIDTLPGVIRDTLRQHGLKSVDYRALLLKAEAGVPSWFRRFRTLRREAGIRLMWQDFVATAKEIKSRHGSKSHRQRSVGLHCGWCEYESLCRLALTGNSTRHVLEREYETTSSTPHPQPR